MATKTAAPVKVKLGARPKSFAKDITFPMLDGSTGSIGLTYKYRTKIELAEFTDAMQAKLKAEADAEIARYKDATEKGEPAPEFTQTEATKRQAAISTEFILASVEGWNLDVPFDAASVDELVDTLPAAVTELFATYRSAITEGRLGN